MTECENKCKYYVRLSDALFEFLKEKGKLPDKVVEYNTKLNYCLANSKFIRSAILACTMKAGKATNLKGNLMEDGL